MFPRFISLVCSLVLAGAGPTLAQHHFIRQVGLKLGRSLAQYRGYDTVVGNGNMSGVCFGGVLRLPINSVFSIQPELMYLQKGANNQSVWQSRGYYITTVTGYQRLNYLELPVLAKLRSHWGAFLEVGPTFSYLLSAYLESYPDKYDNRPDFKGFEVGCAAGVGFQAKQGLMVGVRFTRGLTSLYKAGAYPQYHPGTNSKSNEEAEVYNQVFQLYAGFILPERTAADVSQ